VSAVHFCAHRCISPIYFVAESFHRGAKLSCESLPWRVATSASKRLVPFFLWTRLSVLHRLLSEMQAACMAGVVAYLQLQPACIPPVAPPYKGTTTALLHFVAMLLNICHLLLSARLLLSAHRHASSVKGAPYWKNTDVLWKQEFKSATRRVYPIPMEAQWQHARNGHASPLK
jgi:hypothetical protein